MTTKDGQAVLEAGDIAYYKDIMGELHKVELVQSYPCLYPDGLSINKWVVYENEIYEMVHENDLMLDKEKEYQKGIKIRELKEQIGNLQRELERIRNDN